MRLSLKRFLTILKIPASLAFLVALTGCQTADSHPVFQEYQPGVWASPAQTAEGTQTPSEPVTTATPAHTEAASPRTNEPSQGNVQLPSGPVFQIGDVVTVIITGITSEDIPPHDEQIKDDGTINLYLVGSVKAAGLSPGELQRELQKRYEVYLKHPVVTVQASARFYYVGGEVKRPGAQPYLGETTVTKAIQAAGDFTDFAKKSSVRVIRADGTSLKVNFKKAIDHPSLDPPIYPGDKIHVPRRILW